MAFHITALYAALFTLGFIALAAVVSTKRGLAGISILHGDDINLALWIRRHGNLAENLPLALILMGLCEANGLGTTWLHTIGVVLVLARLSHVVGLTVDRPAAPLRIIGSAGTQIAMLGAAGYLLWTWL